MRSRGLFNFEDGGKWHVFIRWSNKICILKRNDAVKRENDDTNERERWDQHLEKHSWAVRGMWLCEQLLGLALIRDMGRQFFGTAKRCSIWEQKRDMIRDRRRNESATLLFLLFSPWDRKWIWVLRVWIVEEVSKEKEKQQRTKI